MAQVSDITIEKTSSGRPKYIRFEYNKYVDILRSFLQEYNIEIPLLPNDETKAAMKEAKNYKNFERYNSAESLLADCLKD